MKDYSTINKIFKGMKENNSSIHIRYSFSNFKFVSEVSDDKHIGLSYNSTSKVTTCKKCHKPITRYKGTRYATVKYGTVHKKTTLIQFKKRLYYCYDCNCSTIEPTPETIKCTQHSETFKSLILEELKQNVSTYTSVAKSLNTSISSIIRIFDQVNSPNINKDEITAINIDETRFIKSVGTYQFVVIDSASGDVSDVTADRKQQTVESLLETYYPNVELVNQDLWNPYRNVAMKVYGEQVKIVADLFHVVRQGTWAFNRERRSYMKSKETKDRVGVTWRTLMYSTSKMEAGAKQIVKFKLSKHQRLQYAHQAKEMFYAMCRSKTEEEFKRIANALYRYCKKHNLVEFDKALMSVKNWQTQIINSLMYNTSNAISEGVNSLIKQMKRNARGYKNLPRATKLIQLKNNTTYKVV